MNNNITYNKVLFLETAQKMYDVGNEAVRKMLTDMYPSEKFLTCDIENLGKLHGTTELDGVAAFNVELQMITSDNLKSIAKYQKRMKSISDELYKDMMEFPEDEVVALIIHETADDGDFISGFYELNKRNGY